MGYIYNYKELKTKEDYINQLEEIVAYRQLDGAPFDFGTGVMTSEFSLGSEDAYYEMDIWSLESCIEYYEENHRPTKKDKKQRQNKYARNRKHKDEMFKKIDNDWYPVWHSRDDLNYGKRYYRGKRSAFLKKQSNKKIRRYKGSLSKKGNTHRRVFDYWWELY